MKKVLVIGGLTATGKSMLAINWAKKLDAEIISADSVAVYKQLSIASAKPSAQEQLKVKHHGIDLLDVNQTYSIKDFQEYAREKIDEISNKGKLPILVGGSGLYIKSVLYDYQFNDEANQDDSWVLSLSNQDLHNRLQKLDSREAEKIQLNNRKRIIRALTIINQQDKSKSQIIQEQNHQLQYDALMFCTYVDKDILHQNIDDRVDYMIEMGLRFEIEEAIKMTSWDAMSMAAIGVKEWRLYFESQSTLEETIKTIKTKTKQFSKRQRTWFKHQFDCEWLDMQNRQQIIEALLKVKAWKNI